MIHNSVLRIGFGRTAGTAGLWAPVGFERELRAVAARFASATLETPVEACVDVDDFLMNLGELRSWTGPDVQWDDDFKSLALSSVEDAKELERSLAADSEHATEFDMSRLGPSWKASLTTFQVRDLNKLLSLRHGANFSVPGAGKTRVALALYHVLRQNQEVRQLLIVCPKSAYGAWQAEWGKVSSTPLTFQLFGQSGLNSEARIINYERLHPARDALARQLAVPTLMILDEAHRIKLGAAGVYGSAALTLGPLARRRLVLTGTPVPNGIADLETLFAFVWPGLGRQAVKRAVAGHDLRSASRMLKPIFTRTTKVELALPKVEKSIRRLPLPPIHREIYDALLGHFSPRMAGQEADINAISRVINYLIMATISPALISLGSGRGEPLAYLVPPLVAPPGTSLHELLRDLPSYEMSPKYREVLAIVSRNAALGRKTLVWSTFVRSIKTLADMLRVFEPAVVHGGTEDRESSIDRFRHDPTCMVLISNPATLGEGISLHDVCHDAIYVDRDFAAGRFLQSLDRIHRLGLASDVTTNITILSAEGTIDDVINSRLAMKIDLMARILDDATLQELADIPDEPSVGDGLTSQDIGILMGHIRGAT